MSNVYRRKKLSNGDYGLYKGEKRFATISRGWSGYPWEGIVADSGFKAKGLLSEVSNILKKQYETEQKEDNKNYDLEDLKSMRKDIDKMGGELAEMANLIARTKVEYDSKYQKMLAKQSLLLEILMEKSDVK